MPLYDYRCPACDSTFELLVRSGTVPTCPGCGGQALDKLVSLTAPPAQTPGLRRQARTRAMKEGHFSHYQPSERPKV